MLATIPNHQLADIVSAIVNSSRREKIEVLNATDLEVIDITVSCKVRCSLSTLIDANFSGALSTCIAPSGAAASWTKASKSQQKQQQKTTYQVCFILGVT